MTAATAPLSRAGAPSGRGDAFAGTATLTRFMLRRDRVKLAAWVGGIGLFVVYVCTAIPAAYPTDEDLASVVSLFTDPVGRMLTGPGYGLDDPSLERIVANGYGLYLLLLSALMSILLVVRHTRGEEQSGRAELVRANVVGRHAALTASVVVATIANIAAGLVTFAGMAGVGGFSADGSLLLGASVTAVGLAFAGITTITVQLTSYSRAAAGMAGAVLGAAFVLRAGGDMARQGGNVLSWLSPLGWGQQTAPFVLDRWWPLALPLLLAVGTTIAGYAISTHRDLGASLLAVRPGPPRAHRWLGTRWGLALRLQRASIIGWAVSLGVSGLVFGAFADALLDADLPDTFTDVFGTEDLVAGYLAYMATFMAYLVAAYAILAVQGLRADETDGRGEPVLATPVSRAGWLTVNLAVTAAAVVLISGIVGAATGIGAAIVTGDASHIVDLTAAQLNQVPPVLVVLALAALCFGMAPRSIPATWAIIGYSLIVGTFATLLDLPSIASDLSPFEHPAALPLEGFDPAPVLVLTAIALAVAGAGVLGYRRRDIDGT